MGQQQLLLLVLGIVIVGLAVVVGIQAFNENQRKANADALVSDAIRIGSDIQAWKLKPKAFGGGAEATNWTGITFDQLGYETGDQTYQHAYGHVKRVRKPERYLRSCQPDIFDDDYHWYELRNRYIYSVESGSPLAFRNNSCRHVDCDQLIWMIG